MRIKYVGVLGVGGGVDHLQGQPHVTNEVGAHEHVVARRDRFLQHCCRGVQKICARQALGHLHQAHHVWRTAIPGALATMAQRLAQVLVGTGHEVLLTALFQGADKVCHRRRQLRPHLLRLCGHVADQAAGQGRLEGASAQVIVEGGQRGLDLAEQVFDGLGRGAERRPILRGIALAVGCPQNFPGRHRGPGRPASGQGVELLRQKRDGLLIGRRLGELGIGGQTG